MKENKKAENALKKAEAAAAKLQHQSVVASVKVQAKKNKADAKSMKIGRI